jgi:flagellar biosynthesis/type III secretory pathway protein FliH
MVKKEGITALRAEERWCIYFRYKENEKTAGLIEELCEKSEGIMHAENVVRKISRSEEQWARAIFREKAEMDYRSGLDNAREEGLAKGIEKGRTEGIEIGVEKGRTEGIEIGVEKGQEKVLALLDQGYTTEQIRAQLKQK